MHDVKILKQTPVSGCNYTVLAEAEVNGQWVEFKYDRKLFDLARNPDRFLLRQAFKAATGEEPEWGTL